MTFDTSAFPASPDHSDLGYFFSTERGSRSYKLSVWEGAVRIGPNMPLFAAALEALSGHPLGTVRKRTAILSYFIDGQRLCEHPIMYWPSSPNPPRETITGERFLLSMAQSMLEEVADRAERGEPLYDMSALVVRA